jgi:ribonuclease T1
MTRRWIIYILVLGSLLISLPLGLQAGGPSVTRFDEGAGALNRPPITPHVRDEQAAPQKAHDLLARLQARYGKPLPGYIGGREFRNRERRLPPGDYREYDVNPKIRGRSRDAERIVIEQTSGRAYYTGDHYRTFIPLNEIP